MSEKSESVKNILSKLDDSRRNQIIFLGLLVVTALAIRLYNFPLDVPFFGDSQGYFWYAIDMSILKEFPPGYPVVNNGWPTLLSFFFPANEFK